MLFRIRLRNLRLLFRDIRHFQQTQCNDDNRNTEHTLLHQIYTSLTSTNGGEMLDYDGRMLVHTLSSEEGAIDTIIEAARRSTIGANGSSGSGIGSSLGTGGFAGGGERQLRTIIAHRVCALLTLFAQEEAQTVAEKGGFHAIISIMKTYKESEQVQQGCLVALVELARSYGRRDSSASSATSTIILNNVLNALEYHKYSSTVYYLACKALKISRLLGAHVEDENIVKRAQTNILDGIMLFPSDLRCKAIGYDVLSTWVGEERAAKMIQQTALALITACTILRKAMGYDD